MQCAAARQRRHHLVFLRRIRVEDETRDGKLIDPRGDDRHAADFHARVLIRQPVLKAVAEHARRARPVYPDRAQRCERRNLHVLGEVKLLQPGGDGVYFAGSDVEQHHVARFEQVHITQHPPLRRQPRGITTAARRQRGRVVRQKTMKKRCAVAAGDGNLAARRDGANCRSFM